MSKTAEIEFYVKTDCPKIIETAAKDVSDGIFRITGKRPETVKVGDFKRVHRGVILARFCDDEELAGRFAADAEYLRGSDGFAVRNDGGGKIYILSHCGAGVFYGAHDFLEKNADIIWARGADDYAVETLESDKIVFAQADYIEKSPFKVRVWNTCGEGTDGVDHGDTGTARYLGRNKINGVYHHCNDDWYDYGVVGQSLASAEFRNIDYLIDSHPEYFMTDENGNPKRSDELESYINYYNAEVPAVYARIMADWLCNHRPEDILGWNMPDDPYFCMVHGGIRFDKEPFTADDGTTVFPDGENYKSTVYFNFINRLIKELNKIRPNTTIQTQAYLYSFPAPAIRVDDRVTVKIAPLTANEKVAHNDPENSDNYYTRDNILSWTKKSNGVCINAYWNCFKGDIYSRPILKVVKQNLLWWKEIGVCGFTPEGKVDCGKLPRYNERQAFARKFYDLNEYYTWAINKLTWNPHANIEELKARYCRIVYKECAEEMKKYFDLLEKGWNITPAYVWYATGADVYIYGFIVKAGIKDEVLTVLEKAAKKAKTATVKSRVDSIFSTMKEQIGKYENFEVETAEFAYCGGIDPTDEKELDFVGNENSVWNRAKPQTVLRNFDNMNYYDKSARFSRRMLYDENNLYFGYTVYDDRIERAERDGGRLRVFRDDGSEVKSRAETYIGGNALNKKFHYGYVSGFNTGTIEDHLYINGGVPKETEIPSGMKDVKKVFLSDDPKERRLFHVQVVPIKIFGVSLEDFKPYGHFVYLNDRFGNGGWMGFGLWAEQNYSDFGVERKENNAKESK